MSPLTAITVGTSFSPSSLAAFCGIVAVDLICTIKFFNDAQRKGSLTRSTCRLVSEPDSLFPVNSDFDELRDKVDR